MEEVWKDVAGYEGLYQVSNLGRVKSVKKRIYLWGNHFSNRRERILKTYINKKGYVYVCLSKDGKATSLRVHRIVALSFLKKKDEYNVINHKDENPSNNFVFVNKDGEVNEDMSNLEWCDQKYNNNYGSHNTKNSIAQRILKGRSVVQYSLDGKEIARYRSVRDASLLTGVQGSNIRACAGHKLYKNKSGNYTPRFKAGGFKWEYE